jgi:plastocyanin
MWDYIREWHNTKAINPTTGRRNPTITNNSYGSTIKSRATAGTDGYTTGVPTSVTYRGTTFAPGRELTQAELQARGFYAPSLTMTIPYYFSSREADMQDAIDDGIIIVASAGNASWKTVNSSDQDYNNSFKMAYNGSTFDWWLHRGTGSGAGYAPVINVGATSNDTQEDKAPFSNVGSQVDIFAAGEAIQSSLHTGTTADPRNSSYYFGKYQGTSMSGPQVAGVLAILAESWQNINQAEAEKWVVNNANDGKMQDTEADDPMDTNSLQGALNKYLRWRNQRPADGQSYPSKTLGLRADSGLVYPRNRIQRVKYAAAAVSFTPDYTITVTAAGSSAYTMVGTDRNGAVSGNNPTLAFNAGDKVRFNLSASGHPFYIKTAQGTGTGNQASGVDGQGMQEGPVDWTVGSTGTYYYQCQFHDSMNNTITVS